MKKWIVIALVIYTVLIFLPPIIYGYTYPNSGVDSYWHIKRIEDISKGLLPISTHYYGDYIVGYPLILLSKTGIPIATSFMWFNFAMLWMVGISCYLMLSNIYTSKIGLLAIPIFLASPAIMNLYDTGALYNLITMGIILPLSILSLIKILNNKRQYIPILVVLVLLGIFLHAIAIFSFQNQDVQQSSTYVLSEPKPVMQDIIWISGRPIAFMMFGLMSYLALKWKSIKWSKELILSLGILAILIVGFAGMSLMDITGFSTRFAINLGITIALFTMCLLGLVITILKNIIIKRAIPLFVLVNSVPIILTYYGIR